MYCTSLPFFKSAFLSKTKNGLIGFCGLHGLTEEGILFPDLIEHGLSGGHGHAQFSDILFFFTLVKTPRMVCLVAVVSAVYIIITQYSRTEGANC